MKEKTGKKKSKPHAEYQKLTLTVDTDLSEAKAPHTVTPHRGCWLGARPPGHSLPRDREEHFSALCLWVTSAHRTTTWLPQDLGGRCLQTTPVLGRRNILPVWLHLTTSWRGRSQYPCLSHKDT